MPAADNINTLLKLVREKPGKTRPQLQELAGIKQRSSMQTACETLVREGFVSLRNGKHFATPKPGVYVRQNPFRGADDAAAIAIQNGRDPEPSHAAMLTHAEVIRKAVVEAQRRVDEKFIADGKVTAQAIIATAHPPATVPAAIPSAPSLFSGSPAEHLGSNVSKALNVHDAVLSREVLYDQETGDFKNPRQAKLQVEAATATLNLATKVDSNKLAEADFQLKNLDRMIDRMIDNYSSDDGVIEHNDGAL